MGIAAMNYFLCSCPAYGCMRNIGEFWSTFTCHIVSELLAIENAANHYRAMVYGSGGSGRRSSKTDVGSRNVEVTLEVLAEACICIAKKQVLGTWGCRVIF